VRARIEALTNAGANFTLRNVAVVDVRAGRTIAGRDIVVSDGFIFALRPASPISHPSKDHDFASEIHMDGLYVAPGLIDAHVHLSWDASRDPLAHYSKSSKHERMATARRNADQAAAAGITTIRDLGGPIELLKEIGTWSETADVLASGPPLTRPGGHLALFGGEVVSEAEAEEAIARAVEAGAKAVKLIISGGGMTPGTKPHHAELSPNLAKAAARYAHQAGLRVAAHCHATEAMWVALAAEVDTIEHASCLGADGKPKFDSGLAEAFRKDGVVVSPTAISGIRLSRLYEAADRLNPDDLYAVARLKARAAFVRRWADSHVTLVAGSDAGVTETPFDSVLDEVEEYTNSGLDVPSALRTATCDSADALGLADRGEIAIGKRADLFVLSHDPTRDIRALKQPVAVLVRGQMINPTKRQAETG
jgi:imidazolonepropionase-like amidohydrolase